ncbi:MAG: BON domain-containing protein [Coxiellaceae bacterium]|jgi:osmotically-inducible protein OsmY|nr:BON domain-containing protein [Coxiellaceae bacterium]
MRRILEVFLIALTLQACVPAVFVAGTAAGTVLSDHRNTKTMFEDREITFRLQHQLDNAQDLRNQSHVSVTTFNHIVLLLGQTPTAELRSQAEAIVKSNSTVRMLYNEVTIEKPISDVAKANDMWITTKVKTVLAATAGLNSASLKVVTENGVVYLMGLTTRDQAKLATDKTRTVAGVKKVVKLFEY